MSHDLQDKFGLEMARRIAVGLPEHPEWLETARANLRRWSEINKGAPALLRCYAEWEDLLNRSANEICRILTAKTETGQRLRQNSPFAGVLKAQEVWEIKSSIRHAATTA